MPITSVARDPFARGEYRRQSEATSETHATCAWCGQQPRTLYRYAWADDSHASRHPLGHYRLSWSAPFCNLDCHRAATT